MRIAVVLLLGGLSLFWSSPVEATQIPGRPVVTSKSRFRIPYKFDAQELSRLGAREIRLYVSTDRGVNWAHAQSVSPDAGRFEYQAPGEGEFWFAVRTLDAQHQLHPGGSAVEPGLKVIVDTTPPQLQLSLQQSASGQVELSWSASDANLDATKLRLEYIQPGAIDWQQVSVIPRATGQTSWSVSENGVVAVRGTVSDLADNVGRAQSQLSVAAGAGGRNSLIPDLREPIAESPARPRADVTRPEFYPQQAQSPAPHPGPTAAWPRDRGTLTSNNSMVSNSGGAPVIAPGLYGQFISDDASTGPEITRSRFADPEEAPPVRSLSSRHRVVNSSKFQIGYKIDDVGPSGLGSIELYITQDDGQKWWKYGEDPDQVSPYEVSVPGDGVYGFAVRARSGAGLASDPPQPGEQPSIIVVVDQSPPTVTLMPVEQGRGADVNKLLIRWSVSDHNPSDKPVSVYYAASPNGPWEPISGWRQDTGSMLWSVGPGVPSHLYVRVVARDAAGNSSRAETPQPIVVDLSRPSARIVDVEAATKSTSPF